MAELADAQDLGFCASPLLKPTHRYSTLHKVYQSVERGSFKLALLCSLLLIVWLQISQSTFAQEKPDAPKPKHDHKVFIVGTALLAASKTADAVTTRQLLGRGTGEKALRGVES